MDSDSAADGRVPERRNADSGFVWVTRSPSPAEIARLEALFPDVVAVPEADLEVEMVEWQQKAILARSFNKWVPAEAFIREFRRTGVSGAIVPASMAFRCHVFQFASAEACDLVLQRPWVINGQVVATEPWWPEFTPAEDSIPLAMVWVRLPNLSLEFWKVDFLKSFLTSAGDFICADLATLAKNRGAFARACIRVDLRRPLRPGVRIQGFNQPFWQQFAYENLQGICPSCGSLHLGGLCAVPARSDEDCPASFSAFGPWIAAVRQRRVVSGSQSSEGGKTQSKASSSVSGVRSASQNVLTGHRLGKGGASDGWVTPAKVARAAVFLIHEGGQGA